MQGGDLLSASLKFKHINENATKLLTPLFNNKNFLRYIKCLSDDPLNEPISDVDLYSNLVDTRNQDGHFVLKHFDETILSENKIKIFFHPLKPINFTKPLYSDIYIMEIVIPNDYWVLEGKGTWRATAMAYEIAKEIDNKEIAGLGKCYILDYDDNQSVGTSYSKLVLYIRVDNASVGSF